MRSWVRGAIAAVMFGAALMATPSKAEPLRVMTFNIRYATKSDGEDQWQNRREMLAKVVRDFDPDVLGVQEALREQMDNLAADLPGYASVGVGREANGGGEYSALFYRRARFDLEAADTFWLSDTPTTAGSRSWGNTLPRICTWARLVDRTDGRRMSCFNTHWDHQSQPARVGSGKLMGTKIAERVTAGDPVIITGDFNSPEGNPALSELTHEGKLLLDTFRVVHPDEKDVLTAHGFKGGVSGKKIDYIWVNDAWRVSEAAIVRTHEGRRYPSDHYAVTAVIQGKTEK